MTTKQILGLTLLISGVGAMIIFDSILIALIGFILLLMGKKKQENTESNIGKVLFMIGAFLPLPIYILSKGHYYHSFFNDELIIYILCVFLSLVGIGISLKGFLKMRRESKGKTNIGQILLLISTVVSTFPYIIYLIQSFLGATYSPSIYLLDITILFLYLFLVIAGGVLWKYLNKHKNMSTMGLLLIFTGTILTYLSVIEGFLLTLSLPYSLTQYMNSLRVDTICLILGPFICFYGWYKFIGFNKPKSHN